jgi:hypothetical protein
LGFGEFGSRKQENRKQYIPKPELGNELKVFRFSPQF